MKWAWAQSDDEQVRTPARNVLDRAWLIALAAVVAGLCVWLLVHNDPKTYERVLTFVILPSARLDAGEIPDALRSLDQQNSQISGTMAAAVGSKAFLRSSSREALNGPLGSGYGIAAGVRPGSDALTVRLDGPDPEVLSRIGPVLSKRAVSWVGANMRSYRLQQLDSVPSDGPVAPKTFQLVLVAAFLAAALALGAAWLEGTARLRRSRRDDEGSVVALAEGDSRVVRWERQQDAETRRQG